MSRAASPAGGNAGAAPLERIAPPPRGFEGWQQAERDYRAVVQGELIRGARLAWAEMVRDLMPWHLVVNSAQFAEREVGYPISRTSAVRRFQRFFNAGREALGRPLEGFMACEVGPAGGLEHGHGLLWLGGGLRQGDKTILSRTWRAVPGNGFVQLQEPKDVGWFAAYAAKHTVKQMGDVVFSIGCGRQWYEGVG